MLRTKRRTTLLAALSVFTLVAVACGGDDDDATTGTEAVVRTDATSATPRPRRPTPTRGTDTTTADTATTDTHRGRAMTRRSPETAVPTRTTPPIGAAARRAPRHRGRGRARPGRHARVRHRGRHRQRLGAVPGAATPTTGYILLSSVSDPLFAVTDDGEIAPLLVESCEPNDDYTEWTLHIRDGITFHDGTPLDGAAVEFNIETCQYSPLTGGRAARRSSTVDVVGPGRHRSRPTGGPWVALPRCTHRAASAPTCCRRRGWARCADVPQRKPRARRSTTPRWRPRRPTATRPTPVGLGAFTFESYTPGNGNSFKLVRNEDYWRGPNGITGEDLPYLDAIEGVVAVDIDSRSNVAARRPVRHHPHGERRHDQPVPRRRRASRSIVDEPLRRHRLHHAERRRGPETDPDGTQRRQPAAERPLPPGAGLRHRPSADGRRARRRTRRWRPTVRSRPARSATSRTPATRRTTSTRPARRWTRASPTLGTDSIEFTFNTTNDPFNVETNTLIISMWTEVFGDQVKATITPIEQGQYIGLALTGTFQAFGVAQPRRHRPRQQRLLVAEHLGGADRRRWRSTSAASRTPTSTPRSTIIQTDPDPAARKAAAEDDQQDLRRAGLQPVAGAGRCGASSPSRTSTASRPTRCPTAATASAWPSPAVTRRTRSGATTGRASESSHERPGSQPGDDHGAGCRARPHRRGAPRSFPGVALRPGLRADHHRCDDGQRHVCPASADRRHPDDRADHGVHVLPAERSGQQARPRVQHPRTRCDRVRGGRDREGVPPRRAALQPLHAVAERRVARRPRSLGHPGPRGVDGHRQGHPGLAAADAVRADPGLGAGRPDGRLRRLPRPTAAATVSPARSPWRRSRCPTSCSPWC